MRQFIWMGLCMLLFGQCREDEPKTVNQLDLLPAATQSGRHTFGCLVNGQAWVPKTTNNMGAFYQQGVLQVGAHAYLEAYNLEQALRLNLHYVNIEENKAYDLTFITSYEVNFASYGEVGGICEYPRENTLSGSLTITRFDMERYIISGRFEFVTVAEGCDTVRVTDGRFDLPYTP